MKPRPFLPALAVAALALSACTSPPLERYEFREPHMGTEFRLVFYAPGSEVAERAARAAFDRVAELDAQLSDYRADSELSRLGRATDGGLLPLPVTVSEDLARVLGAALELAAASDGAFDPTLGPCTRLWRRSARQGELPSAERLEQALAATGWRLLRLDRGERRLELRGTGMRLDLGGIAKGDALDQALAALRAHGVERALIDGGGDLLAGAPPPETSGWKIAYAGLPTPGRLELSNAALATSGDLYQHVLIDGVRYSHLLDPRTGLGLTSAAAAAVLAPDGITADAVASAVCVLGPAGGVAFVATLPRVEVRAAAVDAAGRLVEEASAGFPVDC